MNNKLYIVIFFVALVCTKLSAGLASTSAEMFGKDISVNVQATGQVVTTQQLTEQADGFYRLHVTLANEGSVPLAIVSAVTSKPASCGHFKTSHSEGGLVIGLVCG